jgi:hypothetical protein
MSIYKEYADLVKEIEALEEQKAHLVAQVMTDIQKSGSTFVENDYGNWLVVKHKTYTYSKAVKAAEERLSIEKSEERENGTAEATEKSVLRFKAA